MAKAAQIEGNTTMRNIIIAAAISLASISFAHADSIDDNVIKAEKAVASATKRLEKAKACAADKVACIADQRARLEKTVASAQKKLAELSNSSTELN